RLPFTLRLRRVRGAGAPFPANGAATAVNGVLSERGESRRVRDRLFRRGDASRGKAGLAPRLLEVGQRVEHFLARRLTLVLGFGGLELLDRRLQGPLLRERQRDVGDEVLAGDRAERLRLLRRDHVHEFPVRHAAVRRRPEPELLRAGPRASACARTLRAGRSDAAPST